MTNNTTGCRFGALVLAVVGTTGCMTTDPAADLARVGALTDERVGAALAPSMLLDAPMDGATLAWDGRAPLTADAAVAVALQHDPALRTALAHVADRRADLAQADRLPNPSLAFGIGIAVDGLSGEPATVSIGEALAWIWERPFALERAEAELERSILDAGNHAVELEARVRTAHADLLTAQQRRTFAEARAGALEQHAALETQRAEAGETPPDLVDAARVVAGTARATSAEAEGGERRARLALLAAMGLARADTDWRAEGELTATAAVDIDDATALQWALERPLSVRAAAEGVRRAEANAELAGLARWPRPTVTVSWMRNFSDREAVVPGLQLELPLLDDGTPARAKASAERQEAHLAYSIAQLDAVAAARTAWSDLEAVRAQRDAFRDRVLPAVRTQADVAAARFQRGTTTRSPALTAEAERLRREIELLELEGRAARAVIELHRALGGMPADAPVRAAVPDQGMARSEVTS